MIKKAILFREKAFPLISFLTTGYWLGEEYLTFYDDEGKPAQGDLVGYIVTLEQCKPLILDELHNGVYNIDFMYVEVEQSDFNRKVDSSGFKNWVGWTTRHKKLVLIETPTYQWIKKL